MNIDPIQSYTQLLATHGVFALVIIFIFIVERRAIRDLNNATDPALKDFYARNHRSAVRVRNVLLIPALLVWGYSVFFPPDRSKVIKIRSLGTGDKVKLEVGPAASDAIFFKREFPGGQVNWDLHPRPGQASWTFTATETVFIAPQNRPPQLDGTDTPQSQGTVADQPSTRNLSKEVEMNISVDGPEEYEYRIDGTTGQLQTGHLYAKQNTGRWNPLPWTDEIKEPAKTRGAMQEWLRELSGVALAQNKPCQADGFPKDREQALNDLGGRDLTVRIAARKSWIDAGVTCIPFLQYAAKNTYTYVYRDRPSLVESLTDIVKQIESSSLPPDLYANLGKENYDLTNYADAISFWQHLDDAFLHGHPSYLFYLGYSLLQIKHYAAAVTAFERYAASDPAAADHNATVRSQFGNAYYQLGVEFQKKNDMTSACQTFHNSVAQFDLAINLDRSLDSSSKDPGLYRQIARDRMKELHCQ